MERYDVIVIGLGGVGSAVVDALSRRGVSVLGLEQHGLVHDRGSSHGQSRIIRKAYFEHPDYVPLLQAAYMGWDELAAETGAALFERTGLLLVGPEHGAVVAGTRQAAALHGLPLEVWDAADLSARFPGFQDAPGLLAVYEADAGLLRVEECVRAALSRASAHGATLRADQGLVRWRRNGDGVVVQSAAGEAAADRLVVCAGAWAGPLLGSVGALLRPQRKVQLWLGCDNPTLGLEAGCPTFGFHVNGGFFYGFPSLNRGSLKLAEHGPGDPVTDPGALDRALHAEDYRRVVAFAAERLVGVRGTVLQHAACMYTMSPDEHFILGAHPEHAGVVFGAGLSGHGFKFMPALGRALADLALDGHTALPIGFLSAERFQRSDQIPMPIVE